MSTFYTPQPQSRPLTVIRTKPSSCSGCACEHHGSDFSVPEGLGSLGVMVIAEASGENEAREGLPLRPYAATGGVYERALRRLGYNREQFVTTNQIRCFVSARTAVLTSDGYRELGKLQPGDLVLTHLGRFRPVKQVLNFRETTEVAEVIYKGTKTKHNVSIDHRFLMADGSWKLALNLRPGDRVKFLAEHCVMCGSAFYRHFKGYQKGLPFCSSNCRNKHAANKGRDKISASMRDQYAAGIRDASTIALTANQVMRDKLATGWRTPRTEEGLKRQRLLVSIARQNKGHSVEGVPWIGFGESAVNRMLTEAGYEFISQFALGGYNYDFRIGDVLLEVDGPASRNVVHRKRDVLKQELAEQAGYRVIHIPHDRPESALDVLANDDHLYEFVDVEVKSVSRRPWTRGVWSLQVAEDESYVAQGAVHHNCRPKDNFLDGAPWEDAAIHQCKPNLLQAISKFKPRVLLALGNVPFRNLTGIRGTQRSISHMRGYVFRALPEYCQAAGIRDLLVVPTFHPSFLRRGAIHLFGVFSRDIQRAVNIAQGKDRSFILDPPVDASDDSASWDMLAGVDPLAMTPEQYQQAYQDWKARERERVAAWLERYKLRYITHPTMQQLDAFCRDAKAKAEAWQALSPDMQAASTLALSFDTETYESASLDEDASDGFSDTRIRLYQATTEPGAGIAVQWDQTGIAVAKFLQRLRMPKVAHNGYLFDNKVLRAVGKRDFMNDDYLTPAGPMHDTMTMFRYWQPDLPAHLQFAASFCQFPIAWKHFNGSNLELYGIFDVDAALRTYYTMRKTMEDLGIWGDYVPGRSAAGYVAMVEEVRPILADMEDRGFPVDDERRRGLGVEFDAAEVELIAELDKMVPNEARKVTPKVKGVVTGYAGVPDRVKELLELMRPTAVPEFREVEEEYTKKDPVTKEKVQATRTIVLDAAGNKVTKKFRDEQVKAAMQARWQGVTAEELAWVASWKQNEPPEKDEETGEEIPGDVYWYERRQVAQFEIEGRLTPGRLAWVRVYEFSPNSPTQLKGYIEAKGHEIPTDRKTGESSTNKTNLARMADKYDDVFYTKVIECREVRKMKGTYIDGFRPHADGRVHTTFTFDTGTMQLSSRNPNVQNVVKNGRLAKAVRSMIREEGKQIVEWDYKSYHVLTTGFEAQSASYMRLARLDMHSFVAGHFLKCWDAFKIVSQTDQELMELFKWFKADANRKFVRDKKAKPCIAEGELVLTDQGLVPIEKITLAHRVWDGVEWVRHGGVIYQGIKEVITYDGLTATKCHRVVTRDGDSISFEAAASRMVRLESTGSAGTPIRTRHRDKLEASAKERLLARACEMRDLWSREDDRPAQFDSRWNYGMPELHADQVSASRSARPEIRCDRSAMLLSPLQVLQGLWSSRNNLQVRVTECVRAVRDSASSSRELQGSGDRQDRQQQTLRAGEFKVGNSQGTNSQSTQYCVDSDSTRSSVDQGMGQSLHGKLDQKTSDTAGTDWRADRGDSYSICTEPILQDLAPTKEVARFARVYDIVDAGPRRCYTVSNKLVFNCILGIGFGLGANKLYDMNRESFESVKEAQLFQDTLRGLFPEVFRWQEEVRQTAHRQGYLKNRFGALRWFYEVYAPDGKGGWKPGEQSEQAIAFLPASHAFGNIRENMKAIQRAGLAEKWNLCSTVHDSLLFLIPEGEKALEQHQRDVYPLLYAPSTVLTHPVLAPKGLMVDVECSVGPDWASLKEVPIAGAAAGH